jgi:hypothetical protein
MIEQGHMVLVAKDSTAALLALAFNHGTNIDNILLT